jgi:tRNA(Ile)-lysidine synthase
MIEKQHKHAESLEERVSRFIRKNGLLEKGQKVLAAVSGGPDSVCLLHCLWTMREKLGIELYAAHLNHGLRGQESEDDAAYVAELAGKLGVPLTLEKGDVAVYRKEHRLSLEEAAREVRYEFLARTAQSTGAAVTAVGHTLNDQVETILLHIIRGSGTLGLRGLQPRQALRFSGRKLETIRPLLEVKRRETEDYCLRFDLKPRHDSTNASFVPLRNRVRHELLPLLETYNPAVISSLLRISRIARDEAALLEVESLEAWKSLVSRQESTFVFEKKPLLDLSPALQRQVFRKSIQELLGSLKDIETRHIEELMEMLTKPPGRQINLTQGLVFVVEYDRYLLGAHPQEMVPLPALKGNYEIKVPGETVIPGWRIETSVKSRASSQTAAGARKDLTASLFSASFDSELAGDKINVRPREKGDRFHPLGMQGTKKLGEFMLDAGIPRLWRERIPVFVTPQQVIWVAGWRMDERVKITTRTRQILEIKMTRV